VANIIKVMSRDAPTAEASIQFYLRLMKVDNALSRARKEMLATVVSNINDCYY
jgi:alkylhydroperoxidase family enzyme